ncbi:proenkephalin-A-like [Menidia menidia]
MPPPCLWVLVLGLSVSLGSGADCGPGTCPPECEAGLDSQKRRLCRDFLFEEEKLFSLSDPQQEEKAVPPPVSEHSPDQELAVNYDGFSKRYGGFMSRRAPPPEPEAPGDQDEDGDVRMEILKIITAERERGGEGFSHGEEPVKRYGGFMRRAEGGGAPDHLLQVVLGRGLKKRYGGFMRRVGRPEWLVENSKSGGVMKRAWENGSGQQKRYGGFMD